MSGNDTEEWITPEEAADYLKVEVSTVKKWVKLRQIPHGKVRSLTRFKKSQLDEWVRESAA